MTMAAPAAVRAMAMSMGTVRSGRGISGAGHALVRGEGQRPHRSDDAILTATDRSHKRSEVPSGQDERSGRAGL